jgi:uncharacterized protein YfaS (alpha-2-macroglobulin family)
MEGKRFIVSVVVSVIFAASGAYSAYHEGDFSSEEPLKIIRMSPDGEDVPSGRQITIQFDRPVVPLGRMDRTDEETPVEIEPSCNCQWRWLNTSALACQLGEEDALRPATRYRIIVHPGIMAQDGSTISEVYEHEFITERPKIRYAHFRTWRSPGVPVIRVTLDQPVSRDSVEDHVYFSLAGKETIRSQAKVEPDQDDYEKPRFIRLIGEKYYLDFGEQEPEKSEDDLRQVDGVEARRVWLVSPEQELPLDTSVELKIEPGLVSALGPERGITEGIIVSFDTFPGFKFLGVRCKAEKLNLFRSRFRVFNKREVLIDPDAPLDSQPKCNPLGRVSLAFSSPVIAQEVKEHAIITPDLAGGRDDYDPWAEIYGYSYLGGANRKGNTYTVPLPEILKAWQEYHIRSEPGTLRDEFGRTLPEAIDLRFFTDHRSPHFDLIHNTAVLEKEVDTEVPLVVTNLDEVTLEYKRLTPEGRKDKLTRKMEIPEVEDVAFPIELGVRKMLDGETGAVYGRISSKPHVDKYKCDYEFFSQVTPYQLHVKIGHFNTLVWVTELDSGEPVRGANITIYKDSIESLSTEGTVLEKAVTDDQGIAILAGTEKLDPNLDTLSWWCEEGCFACQRLFVRVSKDQDMALLPLAREFTVDTYRASQFTVYSRTTKPYGHIHSWGTTAQGVYRVGDTIEYKLYVRDQDNKTFILPPLRTYRLEVKDPKGKTVHEVMDMALSEFGAYQGEFAVPKTGAVGWYSFILASDFAEFSWQPLRVLVSDFTPSPFRVENEVNVDLFHQNDEVETTTYARLHSGGPYTDASARVTARLNSRSFLPKDPSAKGFIFDTDSDSRRETHTVFQSEEMLDNEGRLVSRFVLPDKGILYGRLTVESAVRDDRGKSIACSISADYVGRDRFVGLKKTKWVFYEDETSPISYLVVDEIGRPVKGTEVDILVERLVTRASRVKGAGNAFLTEYVDEWIAVAEKQYHSTEETETFEFVPSEPGCYRITASIEDTKGRPHSTQIDAWVAGKGRVVWREPADNSLQIIPEQGAYSVGDTARYLIKNPFPGAIALVTIERYGVLRHWTERLATSTPIIEFQVQPDDVPGFYLSVVVISPRVDKPLGDGNIDLGKPTFRMGYVSVPVKDPYKEIIVDVKPQKEVCKPRDTVRVELQASPRHAEKQEPIEFAVTVLDEAVFDLLLNGRDYFDVYKGFYDLDGLDLKNYSLLTRLVGRQRFEKKGANSGGGGGPDVSMRSVFKFVSYWNPALKADSKGRATIEFEVPDNLTGWRVFAMAVTPSDRMGLGDEGFKVNRPTEIRPVMPNQVTEGDRFEAGFSVMNRTEKPRTLSVTVDVSGPMDQTGEETVHKEKIVLGPYKRTTVFMPIQTMGFGELKFAVTARDAIDADGLKHVTPVHRRRSPETAATYGTTIGDRVIESLLFPEGIHTDVGGVSVVTSPTVIGNVEGAFRKMRDYPYTCWEQVLSKGVMAAHYLNLRDYLPKDFIWEGSEGLPEKTLELASNHQAPDGGMAYYVPADRYVSPFLSAYTALAFNWLRDSGYQIPEQVEKKLHGYLEGLLMRDVVPTFYTQGMSSTVRATALAALASHGRVSLSDLRRFQSHVPSMSLFGEAHYLQAAMEIEGAESIALDVAEQILGHSSQTGGKFLFNEELDDSFVRILATPLRANAAILKAFVELSEKKYGKDLVSDIPFKLIRSITQARGNRDHWENTQENMFCVNALTEYCRIYESEAPEMTVRVLMDNELIGRKAFTDLRDHPGTFERPMTDGDSGRKAEIGIEREGRGRLYYATRVSFSPLEEHAIRVNAGMEIRRECSVEREGEWVLLSNPMEIRRGELVRVDIFLSLPTVRNFVVVDDPVPGGLEPISRDLATTSAVDAEEGAFKAASGSWWFQFSDWRAYNVSRWCFYHKELRHDSVRFYSDYLPAGNYHLSYTAQAIAAGRFMAMPVHAEEMYDPDVFGKGMPGTLIVSDEK